MQRFILLTVLLGLLLPRPSSTVAQSSSRPSGQSLNQSEGPVPEAVSDISPKAFIPVIVARPAVRHFGTLPAGSALPSDAECAAAVRPVPENKGMNLVYNATRGSQKLPSNFFNPLSNDSRANTVIGARVTGNYVGTTDQIIQWAACKWGIDEDIVRAQTALESWWRQTTLGNWVSDASRCAPGHGFGVDGKSGQCPGSWGLVQIYYYYYSPSWSSMLRSTAYNLDTGYAIWRACFEGYEWWLNDVTHVGTYGAGDVWGCIGRWNTGRWHTADAENYIQDVKKRLDTRFWEQAVFQEP